MERSARALVVVGASCMVSMGCSTYATVLRTDGRSVEADITSSDEHYLYLRNDEVGSGYIARSQVKDIDHPGSVAASLGALGAVVGSLLVVGGMANAVSCSGDLCGSGTAAYAIPGTILGVGSVPPLIWGWAVWADSSSAAEPGGQSARRGQVATH